MKNRSSKPPSRSHTDRRATRAQPLSQSLGLPGRCASTAAPIAGNQRPPENQIFPKLEIDARFLHPWRERRDPVEFRERVAVQKRDELTIRVRRTHIGAAPKSRIAIVCDEPNAGDRSENA
jgi:hypothetical protein